MSKMSTLKHLAVGSVRLRGPDEARIERNLFVENGDTFEALRFCKNRNGRHNRVHLVIKEPDFVQLFASALQEGVFGARTIEQLRSILTAKKRKRIQGKANQKHSNDPFLAVIGICKGDGKLTQNIDEELYGKGSL